MTTGAERKYRLRSALFVALGLSAIWATYWLWPLEAVEPDFRFETHPTAIMAFMDKEDRDHIPYYDKGTFYAPDGRKLAPLQLIRDQRYPANINGPGYDAPFFMKDDATLGDFVNATRMIWSVCSAAVYPLSNTRSEMPAIKRQGYWGDDCARFFPNPPKHP